MELDRAGSPRRHGSARSSGTANGMDVQGASETIAGRRQNAGAAMLRRTSFQVWNGVVGRPSGPATRNLATGSGRRVIIDDVTRLVGDPNFLMAHRA